MLIRWLGAFRKNNNYSLNESICYELGRPYSNEVAVEIVQQKSFVYARIGLLVSPTAIIKKFNGDCWSKYKDNDRNARLYKTRNPRTANSKHTEAWTHPAYTAIIVKNGLFTKKMKKTIKWISEKYNLPVYRLKHGKLEIEPMD